MVEAKTDKEPVKGQSGPRPIDQQLKDAQAKVERIKAQAQKQDASGKIILGGALLAAAKDNLDTLKYVIELIEKRVTRPSDKSRIAPLLRTLKLDLEAQDDRETK